MYVCSIKYDSVNKAPGKITVKNLRLTYRFLKPGYRRHVETSDDSHERIKVANIEALSRSFYPVLHDLDTKLFFDMLLQERQKPGNHTTNNAPAFQVRVRTS